MRILFMTLLMALGTLATNARTLIVYYSYTNNVERIVTELRRQIDADVIEIEPAEKGIDYAANNYAIGSAQIAAIRENPENLSSYPAIDDVDVDLSRYDCIIIGAPLWWSNMAAPLQTFLFRRGKEMAGKKIGLIVSSASSGISGVESDARRLVSDGIFLTPSLWIRSSQTSRAKEMIEEWLIETDYAHLSAGIDELSKSQSDNYTVYSLGGIKLLGNASTLESLPEGLYIVNGEKRKIK